MKSEIILITFAKHAVPNATINQQQSFLVKIEMALKFKFYSSFNIFL